MRYSRLLEEFDEEVAFSGGFYIRNNLVIGNLLCYKNSMKPGIDYIGITTPFFCNDGKGNFLLQKRSKKCRDEHGRWEAGGGQLEFGLTPEENVMKEVLEEYGCRGEIQEALTPHSLFREWDGVKTHWLAVPYFVKIVPDEARTNEPDAMDEIGWFRLGNFPSPLHSGFAALLDMYRNHFDKYNA